VVIVVVPLVALEGVVAGFVEEEVLPVRGAGMAVVPEGEAQEN
jgi:hypothetical protein